MLDRPIGIFDSGVGGLTVLKALRRKLPHRDFIYLGDTARVPYGRKPAAMVVEFAYGITEFLRRMGVEGVVIACNTASASALPGLAGEFALPIWGVIDPGVETAARVTRTGRVGVIGTKGAIASGAYQRRLEQRGLMVWARACPMLVHIVEEGLARRNATCCSIITWRGVTELTRSSSDAHIIRCCALPSSGWWAIPSRWWIALPPWPKPLAETWTEARMRTSPRGPRGASCTSSRVIHWRLRIPRR
jgi:glutamate racemase